MRIAVFGTGGAGGYFGARLAEAGEDVIFIARGAHLEAILSHGLRVDSPKGDMLIRPARAVAEPAEAGPVDIVLLGVKAWQVREAAQAMEPFIGPETVVVPLQNGVEAAAQLMEVLGPSHVLGGLARIISFRIEPGHIAHTGLEPYLAFGDLNGRPNSRAERFRQACEGAGIRAEIPEDIQAALWEKFLFVVSFGGIGAATDMPIGVLRSLQETRRLLIESMEEIAAVARARNIALPVDCVQKTIAFMDTLPEGGTTSLQRDLAEGRPSELEAWNGAVVRLARESGLAAPLNDFIYSSQLPKELRARGQL
ncbi:MAG: 2-dehydropantoate 2-reductase [Desulfohalobiaceae bacterium]|nr:2-dehydropantoate 2-reductase [Desulfohalobiaceae bacterium]